MFDVEVQHERAQQDQAAYEVGVTTAGLILEQTGVLAPVIADFHARPVIANGLQPLLRGLGVRCQTAQVIGVFPRGGLLVDAGPAAHVEHGAHMRKLDIQRIDGFYRELAVGLAPVRFFEEGKRGGSPAMPVSAKARTVF